MKTIIAIDGGGIKGVIPAYFLAELCRRMGAEPHQACDFFAGTSTGGIIALGLAFRIHPQEVLHLYHGRGREIFTRNWFALGGLIRPMYKAENLERLLMDRFGEQELAAAAKPVGVTVLRAHDRGSLMLSTWDNPNVVAWQAARATSAAPIFFPAWDGYWDGGCWANNPSAAAFLRARRMWPGEQIRVLSLGCGYRSSGASVSDFQRAGLVRLAPHLPALLMEGGCDFVAKQLEDELGVDHLRINPDLNGASPAMDDASPEHIADLLYVARGAAQEHLSVALRFLGA